MLWQKLEILQEATCTGRWEGSYARLEVVTFYEGIVPDLVFLLVRRGIAKMIL